jgi:DNA invertase Pin-like site-specific DNA recombinase
MAWAAKIERLAINERIAAARVRLEEDGRSWRRPPRLSALEKARIAALRRKGATIREIAIAMRAPRATVARALSHKVPPVPAHGGPAGGGQPVAARK